MANHLQIMGLSKKIGAKTILDNVSFNAATGDLVVITGPNGAGKTTLLRLISGLSPPTRGRVLWNGKLCGLNHGQVGYISHKSMLYETLTVSNNLQFFSRMYGTYSQEKLKKILQQVGLWFYRDELVAILSRGMQQRLAIARTVLLEPNLILYDEPFTGLDSDGQRLLATMLQQNQPQTIQIVITHKVNLLAGLDYQELKLDQGKVREVVRCG